MGKARRYGQPSSFSWTAASGIQRRRQWLDDQLSQPTTYTFIVTNNQLEDTTATFLGETGSSNFATILSKYPYTLTIAGEGPQAVSTKSKSKSLPKRRSTFDRSTRLWLYTRAAR